MKIKFLTITILIGLMLFTFVGIKTVVAHETTTIRSYRELRYDYLFGQTSWWSCGPASVATLLYYYYQIDTSELEIIQHIIKTSNNDDYLTEGINLLLIKDIFKVHKIEASGYQIDPDSLLNYYDQGGLPLILYFTLPKKHYVIGIGNVNNNEILIADPSFGHLVISFEELVTQKGFTGIVLVAIPCQESQVNSIKNMQSKMLITYKNRRNALSNFK